MSTLQIEERITVGAPPARVWAFLLDAARVAACLPGAKLDGVEGERTFLGTMKVKVGPVLMEFKGKATMSEVDEAERRVTLTGTGNDKSGGGSAKIEMKSHIVAIDGGGSEIVVQADVDLAGKLVRFGRGMMEGISKQLFKQFADRVRAELAKDADEQEEAAADEEAPPAQEAAVAKAEPAAQEAAVAKEEPAAQEAAVAKEEPAVVAKEEPAVVAKEEPVLVAKEEPAAKAEPAPPVSEIPKKQAPAKKTPARKPAAQKAAIAPVENAPLDAGSLVWAALWEWIKNLFRRMFGRKR